MPGTLLGNLDTLGNKIKTSAPVNLTSDLYLQSWHIVSCPCGHEVFENHIFTEQHPKQEAKGLSLLGLLFYEKSSSKSPFRLSLVLSLSKNGPAENEHVAWTNYWGRLGEIS